MTLYQQEMLRKLGRLDCAGRYDEEKGLLVISSGGTGLCCQDKKGYLSWESEKIRTEEEKAVLSQIGEQAKLIRAYVGQYENSPSMGIPEVEGYRRMAECGDTVMAGMYSEQHGFMFTTWTQNGDRSRVTNGDYSPNYEYQPTEYPVRGSDADIGRPAKRRACRDQYQRPGRQFRCGNADDIWATEPVVYDRIRLLCD